MPSIYVRHAVDFETERSIKEVVDGQQRVRCVIGYRNGEFAAKHPKHKAAVYFSGLGKVDRVKFLQSALSVGYLVGATDEDVIEIFARINTVSKTLNPQEKRNAKFSGAYKQFCLVESVGRLPFWRHNGIFRDAQIARMAEVQFSADLVMNLAEGLQDFSSAKLDAYYKKYDAEFPRAGEMTKRLERIYSILLELPSGFLKNTIVASHEVLLSLMLVLDALDRPPSVGTLRKCISELDDKVELVKSGESAIMATSVYEAFTSGNLHRIRYRRLRQEEIKLHFE